MQRIVQFVVGHFSIVKLNSVFVAMTLHITTLVVFLVAFAVFISTASASCECGYLVSRGKNKADIFFTNSLVTDFTDSKLSDIGSDWQRSNYGINGDPNNKPPLLPQYYYPSNVYRNTGGKGLNIRTQAYSGSGLVKGGEIQTVRTDILYGSFRAQLKTSATPGVCQSIFFYRNDSQEIDIELLTSHPQDQHLTNQPHSTTVTKAGFNPTSSFHEYRIDWLPTETDFFVDGTYKATLKKNVPKTPGEILINSWSNGDPTWSEGPPTKDAILLVGKVTLYFNTTSKQDNASYARKCGATGLSKKNVCKI